MLSSQAPFWHFITSTRPAATMRMRVPLLEKVPPHQRDVKGGKGLTEPKHNLVDAQEEHNVVEKKRHGAKVYCDKNEERVVFLVAAA